MRGPDKNGREVQLQWSIVADVGLLAGGEEGDELPTLPCVRHARRSAVPDAVGRGGEGIPSLYH
jgi:hypothetical protein